MRKMHFSCVGGKRTALSFHTRPKLGVNLRPKEDILYLQLKASLWAESLHPKQVTLAVGMLRSLLVAIGVPIFNSKTYD